MCVQKIENICKGGIAHETIQKNNPTYDCRYDDCFCVDNWSAYYYV